MVTDYKNINHAFKLISTILISNPQDLINLLITLTMMSFLIMNKIKNGFDQMIFSSIIFVLRLIYQIIHLH